MKKYLFYLLFITGFCTAAFGQSDNSSDSVSEPDAPSIELPPVFVEIEDQTEDNVETDLPEGSEYELPEFEVQLPEPSGYVLPDTAYDVEIGDVEAGEAGGQEKKKKDYFFDGYAGAGALLNLTGDFRIHKRGKGPTFDLEIKHDNFGIYDFINMPGSGFDCRDDLLDFSLKFKDDDIDEAFAISYRDRNTGMQGQSAAFSSVTDRFFHIGNDFSFIKMEHINLLFNFDFDLLNTTLEGNAPQNLLNMYFFPELGLNLDFDQADVDFTLGYNLSSDGASSNYNYVDFMIDFDVELPEAVNLAGGVGVNWNDHTPASIYGVDLLGFSIPFYMKLYGSASNILRYNFEGGFQTEMQKITELKEEDPWLSNGQVFAKHGWYCSADLKWNILRKAGINMGLDFEQSNGMVVTDFSSVDGTTGLYTPVTGNLQLLYLNFGFEVTPIEEVTLALSWKGEVLPGNTYYLVPEHELLFDLDFEVEEAKVGGGFDFLFQTFGNSDIRMPEIGFDIYYMVTENIKVKFDADDLIAPAFADERKSRGIYKDPGLNLKVLMEFSL